MSEGGAGPAADLASPDPEVRVTAVRRLARERDHEASDLLLGALTDGDPHVRHEAAYALGERGDERAVEPLIEALGDPEVRRAAATALGRIGDARSVGPLVRQLRSEEIGTQAASARALGEIGDNAAIVPLLELAGDAGADPWVRRMADRSARRLGHRSAGDTSGANPILAWAVGLALVAAAVVLGSTLGPFAGLVALVGLALLVVYYLAERRRGVAGGSADGDWPGADGDGI